jgi:Epoxide hydrolase N terminus
MSNSEGAAETGSDNTAVRPFQVGFPEAELTELRRRVNATRWPERETVTDDSQGVPLAVMQDLARYWGSGYDWRACEATLNRLPQFVTEISGCSTTATAAASPASPHRSWPAPWTAP